MTFHTLNLLCLFVFAIHTSDEYLNYDDFVSAYHSRLGTKLTTRPVFRNAAILLTLAVAGLTGLTYIRQSVILITLSKVVVFAILLNGISIPSYLCSLRRTRHTDRNSIVALDQLLLDQPGSTQAEGLMVERKLCLFPDP